MNYKLSLMLAFAFVLTLTAGVRAAHVDDATFVKEAAIGGLFEVKAGKLASENALDADIKKFGDMMAADHGKAADELKELAAKKGWAFPTELDAKHQKKLEKFAALKGADFDKAYVAEMKSDHKKDFDSFKHIAEKGTDTDLRAWASKTLGVVEGHLKHVEAMK